MRHLPSRMMPSPIYNIAGGTNKSAYVNRLLVQEKKRSLKKAILQVNQEETEESDYQDELAEWAEALVDGLEPGVGWLIDN